jgi:hypothetical protein
MNLLAYIVIILTDKKEPSNGNNGAYMTSFDVTEPTKCAEIIEDEDTNIRRKASSWGIYCVNR